MAVAFACATLVPVGVAGAAAQAGRWMRRRRGCAGGDLARVAVAAGPTYRTGKLPDNDANLIDARLVWLEAQFPRWSLRVGGLRLKPRCTG